MHADTIQNAGLLRTRFMDPVYRRIFGTLVGLTILAFVGGLLGLDEPPANRETKTAFEILKEKELKKQNIGQPTSYEKILKYFIDEPRTLKGDLDAQISMARSAESMTNLARFQVWIAFIGTLLLILTLRESRKTARAAIETVNHQRVVERARLSMDSLSIRVNESGNNKNAFGNIEYLFEIIVKMKIKNTGYSQGNIADANFDIVFKNEKDAFFNRFISDSDSDLQKIKHDSEIELFASDIVSIRSPAEINFLNEFSGFVQAKIVYHDIFEENHFDRDLFVFPKIKIGSEIFGEKTPIREHRRFLSRFISQ